MALHLNLYHELHTQAQQRARDPFKLAGLGALVIVILLVGYYFYRSSTVATVERRSKQLTERWRVLKPQEVAAKARFKALVEAEQNNARLLSRIEDRFYWAPILSLIGNTVPPSIQIQQLTANSPSQGRPSHSILLRGIAADEVPRVLAEKFRQDLAKAFETDFSSVKATFDANSLEDTTEKIEVNGRALSTARFVIRLEFTPKDGAAPAKPAAKPAPKRRRPARPTK